LRKWIHEIEIPFLDLCSGLLEIGCPDFDYKPSGSILAIEEKYKDSARDIQNRRQIKFKYFFHFSHLALISENVFKFSS
jgi:hypothetical protein